MKLLYFAWMRGKIGCGEESVPLPEGVDNVGQLISWLQGRGPGYADAFARPGLIRCAVNQNYANAVATVTDADEVAFFPPITGG